jgi:tetratricopeptide (TPR) repeat protein
VFANQTLRTAWFVVLAALMTGGAVSRADNWGDSDGHVRNGDAQVARGNYGAAIREYTAALRLEPGYTCTAIRRGKAWAACGRYDRAIADYNQVIQRRCFRCPRCLSTAYRARGDAYWQQGDYDQALADYSEARRYEP